VGGSKKLIKLTVDAGEEQPRQVVSGIAESYEATDLPGTFILLVANLAPKKIFGVQSHGMALLAETKDRLTFVQPAQEVAPGTKVR
jgi:methionyl-tRNA synthetase